MLRIARGSLNHYQQRDRLHEEIRASLPFRVPKLLDGGTIDGLTFTLEERIPGRSMDHALADLRGDGRVRALEAFVEAAAAIRRATFARPFYGELLHEPPYRSDTWGGYLIARGIGNARSAGEKLRSEIPAIDSVLENFRSSVRAIQSPKALVHGDFFPGNVMIDGTEVTGVLDWSFLTLAGDPRLDLVGAVVFLDVKRTYADKSDRDLVFDLVMERDPSVADVFGIYATFYALDFAAYPVPEALFEWCVRTLREERL